MLASACTAPAVPAPSAASAHAGTAPAATTAPARDVATNLQSPWSMATTPDGAVLVSERDTGLVKELTPAGGSRDVGRIDGVVHEGEGGLLGIAVRPPESGTPALLYAFYTAAADNRLVRMRLRGSPGSYALGPPETLLTGIAKGSVHNGGRIAFGPDGKLYVTTGEAGLRSPAQDLASLNGKILRLDPDGTVPRDNPFPGSPVYSLGHRNPQGIGWDTQGRMWASEFGQNRWDELNLIRPGGNYGWPEVEGIDTGQSRFINPVAQWPTSEASPSGLAISGTTVFMAALRGQRLWVIQPSADGRTASVTARYTGTFGRLRDVRVARGGRLWLLTNNTDGRGTPRPGDDRIVEVPAAGG
ncbi:PQQ-dependent sugar dehydrogenase [Paenarthrobacter sp. DKR-5]|nr:PQQ-dependent sugar dehydrogenase [Paenarthrobacter sp. DKR-5]